MALEVTAVFAAKLHPKFTPATVTAILDATRAGASAKEAAQVAGISRDTLYDWLGRAKRDRTGVFAMFADSYRRAQAEGRNSQLAALIDSMAPRDTNVGVA